MKRVLAFVVVACAITDAPPSARTGGFAPHVTEASDGGQQSGGTGGPYRYEREVKPGAPGANRLEVDLPLLSGAAPFTVVTRLSGVAENRAIAQGGLGDVRFYDEAGHEVAYLLVPPAPRLPEWTSGRILPVAVTKKTSGFEVDLGETRQVDRLALLGLPAPYLKRARLEGSGDRERWTLLNEETTVFDLPEEQLTREAIDFPAGEYRYLRVSWDDTNSARLPLPRSARARLVSATAPPATLRLPVSFERRGSEPGVSRYRLSMPAAHLPVVAIELSVRSGYVLRHARVSESRLSGSEMTPVPLGSATLRRAVRDEVAAAELGIPIEAPQESQLDLIVEDGSNPPLDLTGVTAILAELPWIYFEAPPGSMVARFGSATAAAPRYDLEAVRPSIGRSRIARATWGGRAEVEPASARPGSAVIPVVGATLDAASFSYRRAIPAGPRGLTALRLDAPALAHSRFSDLRVVTPDGHQVAYLVERLDEPLAIDLPEPEKAGRSTGLPPPASTDASGGTQTAYRVALPEPGLSGPRLVLQTSARVFARTVRVLAERDQRHDRDSARFQVLAETAWRHTDLETAAPPLTLALPGSLPGAVWLVVDEGDNAPLPIARPRLLLPAYRLRFFRETEQPLSLLYGNSNASAPRYDLALLAPRLVGATAYEVWPGPENGASPAAGGGLTATRLFWGALVAAVVALLVILARLLRPQQGGSRAGNP